MTRRSKIWPKLIRLATLAAVTIVLAGCACMGVHPSPFVETNMSPSTE